MSRRWSVATATVMGLAISIAVGIYGIDNLTAAGNEEAEARFIEGVTILADDDMVGRGLSTKGIRKAADWIEGQLREHGFEPAFKKGYRQSFQVKTGVKLGSKNKLSDIPDDGWTPLGFSSAGKFSGDLVFAGYGIEAPSIGFQELDGLDLEGKVVLVLRYEPQERDEGSPFDGKKPSRWSSLRYKALQARERGAAAVIFTTGPLQDEESDRLPALKNDGPESPAGIPVLQVKTSVAQAWLDKAGVDLSTFQEQIDYDLTPRPVQNMGITVSGRVDTKATYTETWNVAGLIPGKGALTDEYLVIGAHYDHLGMGGEGSLRPNVTAIHNGADDNASGTVAAIMIAGNAMRALEKATNHRSIIVALFSGEETGLAGSGYFVTHPPYPIANNSAMINLDMVGRLRDDTLVALGSESADEWTGFIERAASATKGLEVTSRGDGYGPSDQTSFYGEGVPVLHLFTGAHDEYHTPDDDADTVDAAGAMKIVSFASMVVEDLAVETERLTYARSTGGPSMSGDSRGYGAYLGTVPDYASMQAMEGGVLLADVRDGGPAALAGIQGGDRIVKMAGTRIENLYDMTYALQENRPGDTIEVVVIRQEEETALLATLGDRTTMSSPSGESAHQAPGESPHTEQVASEGEAHASPHGDSGLEESTGGSPHGGGSPHEGASAHGMAPEEVSPVDPYYEGRPGKEFRIGAGKPFEKTFDGENHLTDVRQLTFGGENAEAYFSPDGTQLIYQANTGGGTCDQQYVVDLATGKTKLVSTGTGRTTCGYFDWPESDRIVYSSTMGGSEECPPTPDHSQGYVWAVYKDYDLYEAAPDGSGVRRLTDTPGYDAEATWCHRGGKLVFTSMRDGDLDLYSMEEDGHVRRLTDTPGYDGGAFYSPDCSEIVWRASRPEGEALDDYKRILEQGLIRPSKLEIFLMDADGTNVRQLTENGAANFGPYFTADGSKIIYASNAGPGGAREFDMFMVDKEGGEPERITFAPGFDGFPMFSPDGRYLVWGSNRANPEGRETNLFIARWVDARAASMTAED